MGNVSGKGVNEFRGDLSILSWNSCIQNLH